jgi:hypothetical protein
VSKKSERLSARRIDRQRPEVRLVFFNLAKMWREMADEAEPEIETVEPSKGIDVVINFPSRAKS